MSRFTKKISDSSNTYKTNIIPIGLKDGVNLDYTLPNNETFLDGTLSVYLSGILLNGNQDDLDKDYEVYDDNTGFTILIDPSISYRLNAPPKCKESLLVSYFIENVGGSCNPLI